jgi:hypothetical protein
MMAMSIKVKDLTGIYLNKRTNLVKPLARRRPRRGPPSLGLGSMACP